MVTRLVIALAVFFGIPAASLATDNFVRQAIVKTKVSAQATNYSTTFFPGEAVIIKESTATSAFVQVGTGTTPLKGPTWIPLEALALPDSFEPITTWRGVNKATICQVSCDGGFYVSIESDGTFRAEGYEGSRIVGRALGRLYQNGRLIWARTEITEGRLGNLKGRMTNYFSYLLMSDGSIYFVEHNEEVKEGCIYVSIGEVEHVCPCSEDCTQNNGHKP